MNATTFNKPKRLIIALLAAVLLFLGGYFWHSLVASPEPSSQQSTEVKPSKKTGYASVNGLKMYYEVHGSGGTPLVLLHGAYYNIDTAFGNMLPNLAKKRQVIALELQGHGRTADIDRPLSYQQMADDTAELLRQLNISQADFFGWSMGGAVVAEIAVRHPEVVRKLATTGSNFANLAEAAGQQPYNDFLTYVTPELFAPKELKDPYDKIAPKPEQWPQVVGKIRAMTIEYQGVPSEKMQAIQAPFLIMLGDRDIIRLEHATERYRMLPHGQLAVLPATDHFRLELQPKLLEDFLAEPMPEPQS